MKANTTSPVIGRETMARAQPEHTPERFVSVAQRIATLNEYVGVLSNCLSNLEKLLSPITFPGDVAESPNPLGQDREACSNMAHQVLDIQEEIIALRHRIEYLNASIEL